MSCWVKLVPCLVPTPPRPSPAGQLPPTLSWPSAALESQLGSQKGSRAQHELSKGCFQSPQRLGRAPALPPQKRRLNGKEQGLAVPLQPTAPLDRPLCPGHGGPGLSKTGRALRVESRNSHVIVTSPCTVTRWPRAQGPEEALYPRFLEEVALRKACSSHGHVRV